MVVVDHFDRLPADARASLRRAPLPGAVVPMAATLTRERFSDPAWIFERKLDGIRCVAIVGGGEVRLWSRNGRPLDARFPRIAAALASAAAADLVVDGEVVAFEGARTSFAALQGRGGRPAQPFLYLFDVLHLDGFDTTALPLRARKAPAAPRGRGSAGRSAGYRTATRTARRSSPRHAARAGRGWWPSAPMRRTSTGARATG